ncbi:pyruvate carrier-like protein [Arabidopsis thaliana]|uniref:Isoform 2 of Mitochondrial pyruvate carrier 3 n=1 Tax=Arabidopsis thaliana TaxID=3702 RepID=Q8LD38-2|nr:pyruvate carrier-like protein [Arabidopsis thaliana]AAO42830.1 At4g05590 [Arabidopsis thaliana]AEE82536.1 pyruvate carrier-like protein [Arabidopsis thaliana]BAE99500.1 hypothetical protein [Arabidopsis thaliana]|eukprot:NP_001031587.1 pyruvate carrier-like protein [Arabidopsis thaliana]
MATSKLQALWNHPAGPKTIHFWAPTFKWGISIANIADFQKPPETLSYPQQIGIILTIGLSYLYSAHIAVMYRCVNFNVYMMPRMAVIVSVITGTGLVWSRYSTVITPKNWNLFSVSLGMAVTGIYQLTRKIKHDYVYEANSIVAKE